MLPAGLVNERVDCNMSSPLVAPPVAKAKALFCPNCGGPVELRGFGHSLTVVCQGCLTVLDASTPLLKVLQQIQEAQRRTPIIPLGTRGELAGVEWEAIGFQTRGIKSDGVLYEWSEYLLFSPYRGFRYLTEYNGHWNIVTPLESMPTRVTAGKRPVASFGDRVFKHFSGAQAATTFVLGEFPWRVKVGDKALCDDFVDPPLMLSSETTEDEVTWSKGEYTPGAEIWKAFGLPGTAPRPQGVFANQPSPFAGKIGGFWGTFGWMVLIVIGLAAFFAIFSRQDVVFHESYRFASGQSGETSFVTPVFDLEGRTSTLELAVVTNLSNDWAYFNFGLIDAESGTAFNFGREVSAYSGTDSDGAWTEGSSSSSVMIPSVPPGRYYLWVEPEMQTPGRHSMYYQLVLRHDVPNYTWFWLAALLLLIPPIVYTIRARAFETRRLMESDYAPVSSGDD